jgi:hypothetical protein
MAAYENFTFEIDFVTEPDDPVSVWTDLTSRVESITTPLEIVAGENPEDADPANTLTVRLNNRDQALTMGNLLSANALDSVLKCRLTETIGDQELEPFFGYIQFPQIDSWTESSGIKPRDQIITVTAVDQLARLARATPFVSALAEQIVWAGGDDLVGYWPMTEPAEPFAGLGPITTPLNLNRAPSNAGTADLGAPQFQTGLAPVGGESLGARLQSTNRAFLQLTTFDSLLGAFPVGANDAAVVVFWFAFTAAMATNVEAQQQIVNVLTPSCSVVLTRNISTGVLTLDGSAGTMTCTIPAGPLGNEALMPIGVYIKESTSTVELWIGSQRIPGTLAGSPVGAGFLDLPFLGNQIDFDVSHIQFYVGQNWGYTQYLEQIHQGYSPLDRQTPGQRINTLLNYAGYPAGSPWRDIDDGASILGPATLAGASPKAAIDVAVETEQGRLWANGHTLTFADRLRLLNV